MDRPTFEFVNKAIDDCLKNKNNALNLANLKLMVIPESIKNCFWIEELYLNDNEITKIENLENLSNLKVLYLNNNFIVKIENLNSLNKLGGLYLNQNNITKIENLASLINLKELYLNGNQITKIENLNYLDRLSSLSISNNKIETFDTDIQIQLPNIEELKLDFNYISDISGIEALKKLKEISLNANKITSVDNLTKLPRLKRLSLSNNKIEDLVPFLETFLKTKQSRVVLKKYYLPSKYEANFDNNPIISPPIELIKKGDIKELKAYIKELKKQGKAFLYEAKLLIVGEGGSGKTTLAWKIKDINSKMPKKGNDRTRGIDIQGIDITNIEERREAFKMNIWDFGGQEIYHSTHQFFLTKRSLYVIVNNTRTNHTDFNYWLQTIGLFSENSPVFITQNEVDGALADIDERGLKEHFSNIKEVIDADFSKQDERLEKLIKKIKIGIQGLDHVGSELPKSWVAIRNELNNLSESKSIISNIEFYDICRKNGILQKEGMKHLASFLHDLGVFLFFQDDSVLKNIIILKNSWATKGVYQILDNKKIQERKGHFTEQEAQHIWLNTPFYDMHDELLQLMKKFELCYQVPYINSVKFVSPQLLPKQKPEYQWDSKQNLHVYYDYDFLPKGLIPKLIVRLYRFIKDIDRFAWQSGCLFIYENTEAQVIETYGNKQIEVRIRGIHSKSLAAIILDGIDELNKSFERIKVKKMIPCNCKTCSTSNEPYFYDYNKLLRRKEKLQKTVECELSYEDVWVAEILDGIYEKNKKENNDEQQNLIKDLIRLGKIQEALYLFEEESPKDGLLLLQRYYDAQRKFSLGLLSNEDWSIIRLQIGESLLELPTKNKL